MPADATERDRWLTRGVASVGVASFFSDAGHEITTSLLPTFLTSTLRASAGALGLIEGISNGLIGVAKLLGGPLANEPHRRGELARGGYIVTALATGAIGAAGSAVQTGLLRALSWAARGARSPARDALLASLTLPQAYGRAFGLERAADNAGAVAGPLLASALLAGFGIRPALYLAAIPGAFAAVAIMTAAAEARRLPEPDAPAPPVRRLQLRELFRAGIARPLVPITLFELGNCALTLLILRATELLHHGGRSLVAATSLAILLYAANNFAGSLVAYGGGHLIDRVGPRLPFAAGAALFACSYAIFAWGPHEWPLLLGAFLIAGAGLGVAEAAQSTLVARALPDRLRGSGFGLLGGIQSAGDLSASAAVGAIWAWISPLAAFVYASAWMVAATAAGLAGLRHAGDAAPA